MTSKKKTGRCNAPTNPLFNPSPTEAINRTWNIQLQWKTLPVMQTPAVNQINSHSKRFIETPFINTPDGGSSKGTEQYFTECPLSFNYYCNLFNMGFT